MRARRHFLSSLAAAFLTGMAARVGAAFVAQEAATARRWVCTTSDCEPYIYDPAAGDALNVAHPGKPVPPGTPFSHLPANWLCPVCGAPKDSFVPL